MTLPAPSITIVLGKAADSPPYAEAFWRHPMPDGTKKPKKRRLGKIWVERDGDGWKKRRGRTPDGWLDQRTVNAAAAEAVAAFAAELADQAAAAERSDVPTFRQVAWEWHRWKRDVKGATPKTLSNDAYYLADPGVPHKRGGGRTTGRIMAEFGDLPYDEIDAKMIAGFLSKLDAIPLEPRNVNLHRTILHSIFAYCCKVDTYGLPENPVTPTDRRPEPPRKKLNYYEQHEIDLIAQHAAEGAHRTVRTYERKPVRVSKYEQDWQRFEDQQDAALLLTKFWSGGRLGEVRDLRIGSVEFSPALDGAFLHMDHRLSDGESIPGTKWHDEGRPIPVPEAAARVLAAHMLRLQDMFGDILTEESWVFCNRDLGPLSESAFRKRYKKAVGAAGLRMLRLQDLRHAAGSHVGKSSSAVFTRDWLGHSKLTTTDRYAHSKMRTPEALATVNRAFREANESMRGTDG